VHASQRGESGSRVKSLGKSRPVRARLVTEVQAPVTLRAETDGFAGHAGRRAPPSVRVGPDDARACTFLEQDATSAGIGRGHADSRPSERDIGLMQFRCRHGAPEASAAAGSDVSVQRSPTHASVVNSSLAPATASAGRWTAIPSGAHPTSVHAPLRHPAVASTATPTTRRASDRNPRREPDHARSNGSGLWSSPASCHRLDQRQPRSPVGDNGRYCYPRGSRDHGWVAVEAGPHRDGLCRDLPAAGTMSVLESQGRRWRSQMGMGGGLDVHRARVCRLRPSRGRQEPS
jgi:hypothetical protein